MAGPITWRTVNGPSLAEASRPMESAQRSFDNAFTGLGGVLKQQEATDQANWNQIKENNTQDFLNKLYSAQGAEGFKALQDSGELDRMLAANGAQIDRAAARSAMDGRLDTLQQRDIRGLKYGEERLAIEQAPATAEGLALAQKQDPVAFNAWLAANPQNRRMAEVLGLNRTVQQSVEDQTFQRNQDTRAGNVDARAAEVQPGVLLRQDSDLKTAASQRAVLAAQAQKYRADARRDEEAARKAAAELKSGASAAKAIDAAYKEFVKGSALDGGTLDTEDGKKTLREGIKDLVNNKVLSESQVSDIYYNINKYFKEGVPVGVDPKTGKQIRLPLPANAVIEAIQQSSDNPLAIGFSRKGDDVAEKIAKRFGFNTDVNFFGGADGKGTLSTNESLQKGKDSDLVNLLIKANDLKTRRNERLDGAMAQPTPTALANTLRELVRNTGAADPKK
jgi:hypothetical protein